MASGGGRRGYYIHVQGSKEARELLRRAGKRGDAVVRRVTREVALEVEAEAKKLAPVAFGVLRAGITTQFDRTERNARVGVLDGAAQKYAPSIEFGRRPGRMPPLEPLKLWARRVLHDEGAAFPVARAIALRGTKSKPFLKPAFDRYGRKYIPRLKDELRRALEK